MRMIVVLAVVLAVTVMLIWSIDTEAVARWAAENQRSFQNRMAGAVHALRANDPGALTALLVAAGSYGFFHAVGPGHGKALIGGVGVGSQVSTARLLSISVVSSLLQSLWAIVLVYGGFALLELSARRMTSLAEDYLAPASYLAIAAIGALLIWRGVKRLRPVHPTHDHDHHHHDHHHDHSHDDSHGHDCGCHSHGPSADQVAGLTSLRETFALILSIAIRPCTGAIFLLVIAWQMDIRLAGVLAVIVMGLGTATFTSMVAVSSVALRGLSLASAGRLQSAAQFMPALQIVAGGLVMWISLTLLIG
jgi:ABC-type nickel/cobalt efflux system permease component RcnA